MINNPLIHINNLKQRADIIRKIREFFYARHVLEVETPLMCHTTVTDAHLHSYKVKGDFDNTTYYLQTSPEYAMKRLLASGSGSIFQICKAFRDDECGRLHNAEFTMLEWYRVGFHHHDLMDDMDDLLQTILNCKKAERLSYAEAFQKYLNLNPHTDELSQLVNSLEKLNLHQIAGIDYTDRDVILQLLMTHGIENKLGVEQPTFIYDYPASQAALAKINSDNPLVAERFEVYINGIELANGFHELQDPKEQRQRFEKDLIVREKAGLPKSPIDERFLASLESGLPNCAGVALGIDRLVMIALGAEHINDVIAFPTEDA